jgi:hypothetical protein
MGEWMYRSTFFLTSALVGDDCVIYRKIINNRYMENLHRSEQAGGVGGLKFHDN